MSSKLAQLYRTDKDYREKMKAYSRNHNLNLKLSALDILGGVCKECGFDDHRALQIDHINGDGAKDKKIVKSNYYWSVIESTRKKEKKYQVLCANCNWIKRFENKEVTKKTFYN